MINPFAVQKAIDAVLEPVLAGLNPKTRLWDKVPANAKFPFVEFSRLIDTPENFLSRPASRVQVTLTVYSDFRGQEQVLNILAAIRTALDDATLTLDSGTAVRCDLEGQSTTRDADGVTFMGSAIYSVLVE